jgi:glycosyltransferase involved in cell wall biosynthesis
MRIAYYSHYFTPEIGAPSARIHEFAREWLAMGHEVHVVTCYPNHPTGKLYPGYTRGLQMTERIDGIQVRRNWTYITANKGFLRKTIGHVSFWPSACLLTNRRLIKPDVAIGTSPTFFASMAAASLARKHNIPFVMEVRDLWPAIFVDLGVLRSRSLILLLERWELAMYRRASAVITVTDSFRDNLINRGIPEHKVFAVLNGADVDFWRPAEPDEGVRTRLGMAGRFVVLYIGAHGISHGLDRVLGAAKILRDEPKIQFVFVGEGAEKDRLVRAAKDDGLTNVSFCDPVNKEGVRQYYCLAGVCLVPLRNVRLFDAFIPSKMFEIMAMGRPIVASLRGEAARILRNSGSALIVEPEDSDAMAQSILYLCDHPKEAQTMGRRGRSFVEEHYSRRSLAARYLEIIKEAVALHGERP